MHQAELLRLEALKHSADTPVTLTSPIPPIPATQFSSSKSTKRKFGGDLSLMSLMTPTPGEETSSSRTKLSMQPHDRMNVENQPVQTPHQESSTQPTKKKGKGLQESTPISAWTSRSNKTTTARMKSTKLNIHKS